MIIDWKCYFLWSVVICWSNPSYLYQFSDNLWCNIARATVRQSLPGVSWPCLSIRVNTCVWSHRCDQVICNTCHFSAPLLLPVPRSYRCWAFRSESGAYDEDQIQTSLKKERWEAGDWPLHEQWGTGMKLQWSWVSSLAMSLGFTDRKINFLLSHRDFIIAIDPWCWFSDVCISIQTLANRCREGGKLSEGCLYFTLIPVLCVEFWETVSGTNRWTWIKWRILLFWTWIFPEGFYLPPIATSAER